MRPGLASACCARNEQDVGKRGGTSSALALDLPTPAVQKLLDDILANALENVGVAAFDTRTEGRMARLFGYAAGRIADSLKQNGSQRSK